MAGGSTATFRYGIADVSEVSIGGKLAIVKESGPSRELSLNLLQNDIRNNRIFQKIVKGSSLNPSRLAASSGSISERIPAALY